MASEDSNPESLQLVPASKAHLRQMMSWFPTPESCLLWGGTAFRFPFTEGSFVADTKVDELPSYALVTPSDTLCGFGQFYLRAGRCHLSRLAIAPTLRRRGFGARLIQLLMREGTRALGVSECSLFVDVRNAPAVALYERLGFTRATYPGHDLDTRGWYYMVLSDGLRAG